MTSIRRRGTPQRLRRALQSRAGGRRKPLAGFVRNRV
jgi:hypothetical protein